MLTISEILDSVANPNNERDEVVELWNSITKDFICTDKHMRCKCETHPETHNDWCSVERNLDKQFIPCIRITFHFNDVKCWTDNYSKKSIDMLHRLTSVNSNDITFEEKGDKMFYCATYYNDILREKFRAYVIVEDCSEYHNERNYREPRLVLFRAK